MFSLPPLPPPDLWPTPEEAPWLADSATVLQPKALLPTPRYCQPPPTYRQRPPLFPVPPPGSCLLPPPPLATCDGLISPHSWHEATPSKTDRWRKMSWTAGEASPPPAFYNYQRAGQARPRTLVEVPLQPQSQPAVLRSDPQPIQPAKQSVNIVQSNLDPTSRPFTPASFQSLPANSYEDFVITSDKTQQAQDKFDTFSYFGKKPSQAPSDVFSEETLSTSSISRPESSFISQQGSFFADDPLPEDLKFLLPELDNTEEDLKDFLTKRRLPPHVLPDISSAILPPPIVPFASHWSGKSRPPLLPTPKNFPPYGPRPVVAPIYEEDFTFSVPPTLNPMLSRPLSIPKSFTATSSTYKPFRIVDAEAFKVFTRKPDVVGRLLSNDKPPTAVAKPSHHPVDPDAEISSEVTSMSGDIPRDSLPRDGQDWDPSFPVLEPSSLLDPHPVPDEYMVAKVIGGKLPPIKLPKCHTDLLLFLFYAWQEDTTQLVAASLLFERGWRYHTVDKVWLARWPGVTPEKKTTDWEEGLYQYFDVKVWRRIPGWFRLNYVQLAEKTGTLEQEASLQSL